VTAAIEKMFDFLVKMHDKNSAVWYAITMAETAVDKKYRAVSAEQVHRYVVRNDRMGDPNEQEL